MYKFKEASKRSLTLYNDIELIKYMNDYNKGSVDIINELGEELKNNKGFLKVKSYKRQLPWGEEKIFLPFTNKLFKIVEVKNKATSIQLHPLKDEIWISLNKINMLCNHEYRTFEKGTKINIVSPSIHSMGIGKVFEIQDNILFDNKETLRISDYFNRNIDKDVYLSYMLPKFVSKIKCEFKDNYSIGNINSDFFLFVYDGKIEVNIRNKIYTFESTEELIFVEKGSKVVSTTGKYVIIEAKYYDYTNDDI